MSSLRSFRHNSSPSADAMFSDSSEVCVPQPMISQAPSPVASTSQGFRSPVSLSPSPSTSTASVRAARTHQYRLNAAQEHRTYHDSCQRLLTHITSVVGVCDNLRQSIKTNSIHYPALRNAAQRPFPRRAQTVSQALADHQLLRLETASQPDMGSPSSVTHARRSSIQSAIEPPSDFTRQEEHHRLTTEITKDLSILNLDLKVGHSSANITSLEKQSISTLLDDKLSQCLRHLDKIFNRVADTSSKVLITGDLNAGKSTFVNALLKRDILSADQQPCTSMFCEVLDATLNDGVEQMHAIPDVEKYDRLNPSTYHVVELRHLYTLLTDRYENYGMLKIYANDSRSAEESLLHNGVVDIALIDSPGLNTDSVKTTAVFARQEEIDVVVFVVSAENHFTLSGKEFLWNAANEKTHIFIVVNRFDSIRDKERCKRLILDQIRQLSPATYADADDLVHFVSAGNVDLEPGSRKLDAPEFARLEERLRAFVLGNRTKSKLLPAKNYLVNLLLDIGVLSQANKAKALEEYNEATQHLQRDLPEYENLLRVRERLVHQIDKAAELGSSNIQRRAISKLNMAVEKMDTAIHALEYPGIFLIWQYAQDIADSMSKRIADDVRQLECQSRQSTLECLEEVHMLGAEHLGNFPRAADVDKMFMKKRDRGMLITVETTDFFDLLFDEKLSGAALSFGAVAMVGSRMLGIKDAVSSFWHMSTLVGAHNMRRLVVPAVGVASLGLIVYVVSDMRHAVERKLVKKFKASVRDTGYVESQGRRLEREARKVLRVEGWEIQNRLQKMIENKEIKRNEMEAMAHSSQEMLSYFTSILDQSSHLLDQVQAIPIDSGKAH